ncbi:undecaprenyl/decaprenyl-phosphate alpha-N-acetylglucosaminyl 1-phosphate transferase [Metabacillus litoralis]|uniref:Undecaprenyl/decaprenyl-phosphate alpha-N-acetylglucosaminyl 1-phosphate transferase n=1 Tax=Metabacillus litoralis TaxID=152268 RepID=A0A5C6W3M4_9BACI|nr:MraY family glycosyltransferase [Metabacillus litoralis]TXC90962.1 undecaprenyl/decaprenyl-phosphate alpha-N-acetylglucosaminyl 1-phosphate transferase [Metabacillus litoralis]
MHSYIDYIVAFILSFAVAVLITPLVKKIAIKIGATDQPNTRKIHKEIMPRMGGLAIFIGVIAGFLYLKPQSLYMTEVIIGAFIIILIGILDDRFTLQARYKFLGQLIAAIVVASSGLLVDKFTIPFFGIVQLDFWSYPVTVLWIVAITNAINLIDGLDGLAAGVSSIAMTSILIMAFADSQIVVIALCTILIGSSLGFLVHNFYPAKIFMGDTGALFLGYSISIISMLGLFKNLTLFSFVIPIIVLAVPIFDTVFAIIRRFLNKRSIAAPDKLHLHYCLVDLGFSHRTSVLIIYFFSACFGFSAIIFSNATLWLSLLLMMILLLAIQFIAELVGLIGMNRKPLINTFRRLTADKKPDN